VFFGAEDYATYIGLLAAGCRAAGVVVWAYCLMSNPIATEHVHLILVPGDIGGLARGFGRGPSALYPAGQFARGLARLLWQGRFASVAMDERIWLAAASYVELNPARARLAERAGDWRWSSARPHPDGATTPR
jgi:putative transposase